MEFDNLKFYFIFLLFIAALNISMMFPLTIMSPLSALAAAYSIKTAIDIITPTNEDE